MKALYYDCFSGISGDMNLGALVDLGVDKDYLISELLKLNLNEYELSIYKDNKMGIEGTRVDVILQNNLTMHQHCDNHEHDLDHIHNHEHNSNDSHEHSQEHNHDHLHHVHRNLRDIEQMIDSSALNNRVKALSKDIFMKVAEAEAKVHGKTLYEVHFHEVGAVDSIVDIVGAAICLDYLKIDRILSSTIEVGSGFVRCAHGVLPVPAPATAEILKGSPIKSERVPFEATTPTGAAILASIFQEFRDKKDFTPLKVAYGIGKKDGIIPNVLRVMLVEEKDKTISEEAVMLECNIDDMNPEIYEYVMEKLFDAGAQDVFMTPIIMKKGRPAVKFSVLCCEAVEAIASKIIFEETTTLGIRKYKVIKNMLSRKNEIVHTIFGDIRVKSALLNDVELRYKFENKDCRKAAEEHKIPLYKVYKEAERQWDSEMQTKDVK